MDTLASLLSVMLNEALRWGWIESNPLRHMRKHKEEERRCYLSDEELQKLIDATDFQMSRLIRIAYLTALRMWSSTTYVAIGSRI
jgi:hypothetical protein